MKALTELNAMVNTDGKGDTSRFAPAVVPLISFLGWDGVASFASDEAEGILCRIGKPAAPAVVAALQNVKGGRPRESCVRILATVDRQTALAVLPDLLGDSTLRRQVIQSLGGFGSNAGAAVGKIKAYLDDPDPAVRVHARGALVRITGKTKPYVDELATMSLNPDRPFDSAPVQELWSLGDRAESAYPRFIKAFTDSDLRVRRRAVGAFNWKGPQAPEVVMGLIKVLRRESDSGIIASACGALATIGPAASAAVPALIEVVRKDEEKSGWTAVLALAGIHTEACYAPIAAAVASKHKQTRIDVAYSLSRFADQHPEEVRSILKTLADDADADVQRTARQELELLMRQRGAEANVQVQPASAVRE